MSVRTRPALFGFAVAMFLALGLGEAVAQVSGSVSGMVRDANGAAVAGVSLTLSPLTPLAKGTSPGVSLHATTDKMGAFRFDAIAFDSYRLSSDRPGDALTPNALLTLSATTPAVRLDIVLSGGEPVQKPGLQLQAAGIRGYIDPGGYSAPAGAAAASKLIQGAAGLNVSGNSAEDSDVACSLEPVLLKAVADHPESAVAHRRLGQYYVIQQQPEKALAELRRARALDEHDPKALVSLAEALLQTRQFAAARDLLTADASGADKATVHRLLARCDEGLGAFQQASAEYQAAAALEPSEAAFYGAGYELILAGSAAAAGKIFEAGTTRYPDSTTLLMGIGTADFLQGQSAEATRIFLRCAELRPDDSRLYPFLSASFAVSGVDRDAVEARFRRYYELHPESADAAYFYALMRLRQEPSGSHADAADAEALLKHAVQLEPGFARAQLQLGSVYFDHGDYTHAAEEFAATLRLDPGLWETHYKLSMAYKRAGQADLAEQQMRLFLAKKSQDAAGDQASVPHVEQYLSIFAKPEPRNSPSSCAAQR